MGRGVAEMKINARGSPWADFDGADLVYWRGRSEIEIDAPLFRLHIKVTR